MWLRTKRTDENTDPSATTASLMQHQRQQRVRRWRRASRALRRAAMVHYFVVRARLSKYLLCRKSAVRDARSRKMRALLSSSTTLALHNLTLQQLRSSSQNRRAADLQNN